MEERHGERSGEENAVGRAGRSGGIWVRKDGEWVGKMVGSDGASGGSKVKKVVVLVRGFTEEEM